VDFLQYIVNQWINTILKFTDNREFLILSVDDTDGFYDFFCGCRLLKQGAQVFNVGMICPKHSLVKDSAFFYTMVQNKIDNGVKPN